VAGNVTEHFYTAQDRAGYASAPAAARGNLDTLAGLLEDVRRGGGGVPMLITSGYRNAVHNAAVGGSDLSQHLSGSAVDFQPVGIGGGDRMRIWADDAVGSLPPQSFGQIILYPWSDGHVHASLPNRASGRTGEVLVETGAHVYSPWRPGTPFPVWGGGGATDRSDTEGAARIALLFWVAAAILLAAIL